MAASSDKEMAEQQKLIQEFQRMREGQQSIAEELTRIEEEKREFSRVIDLLKDMDPKANCFHLISDTLVEQNVGAVLPFLEKNLKNLGTVADNLNKTLVDRGKELNEFRTKHNIRILSEKESQEIRAEMARQATSRKGASGKIEEIKRKKAVVEEQPAQSSSEEDDEEESVGEGEGSEEEVEESSDEDIEDEEGPDTCGTSIEKKKVQGEREELEEEEEDDEEEDDDEEGEEEDDQDEESDQEEDKEEEEEEEPRKKKQEEGDELDIGKHKPEVQPVQIDVQEVKLTWSDLGLSGWIVEQMRALQLRKPTPVQAYCIPKVIDGSDVLGCAKTGTGKTLAFALPILNELAVDPYGVFALVLTPTRELALQIVDQFRAVGKPIGLKVYCVIGGTDSTKQTQALSSRPHVVVATPGRLAELLLCHRDSILGAFKRLRYFVLDEADQMLTEGFAKELKIIFAALPKQRQTLLFSATITSAISQLHKVSTRKPYFFEDKTDKDQATVEKLEQKFILCPRDVLDAYLVYVVKNYCERNEESSVIVFCESCRECQALAIMFNNLGFKVGSLHAMISQKDRNSSLHRFRSSTLRVLVCTDVASRGLDIPHVDLVVNHNVPRCPKTYIHRVGRAARAGRYGSALTFVSQTQLKRLKAIEAVTGKQMDEQQVNDKMVTKYVTQVLVSKREAELTLDQQDFGKKRDIFLRKDLIMGGMDHEEADREVERRKKIREDKAKGKVQRIGDQLTKQREFGKLGKKEEAIFPVEDGEKGDSKRGPPKKKEKGDNKRGPPKKMRRLQYEQKTVGTV